MKGEEVMFTVGSNGNNIAFGVKQLILDDKSDLKKLSETEKNADGAWLQIRIGDRYRGCGASA